MNRYECEIEVTVDGDIDLLIQGSITTHWVGIDDEGRDAFERTVTVDAAYPVVLVDGDVEGYADRPLSYYRTSWRDTLLQAIEDEAQSDWERRQE